MAAHEPPVPPANRSTKGPGEPATEHHDAHGVHPAKAPNNIAEQGDRANVKQNTTGPGQQQR